jgi:hypothetical protein
MADAGAGHSPGGGSGELAEELRARLAAGMYARRQCMRARTARAVSGGSVAAGGNGVCPSWSASTGSSRDRARRHAPHAGPHTHDGHGPRRRRLRRPDARRARIYTRHAGGRVGRARRGRRAGRARARVDERAARARAAARAGRAARRAARPHAAAGGGRRRAPRGPGHERGRARAHRARADRGGARKVRRARVRPRAAREGAVRVRADG